MLETTWRMNLKDNCELRKLNINGRRARVGAKWVEEKRYCNLLLEYLLIYSLLSQQIKRAKRCPHSNWQWRGGNASKLQTIDYFIAMINWFRCLSYPRLFSWGTQIDKQQQARNTREPWQLYLWGMVSLNYYLLVIDWGEIGEMKDCVGLSLENFSRRAHPY